MPLQGSDVTRPEIGLAPFRIVRPAEQTAPLVFASPHSGRDYPAHFLHQARLDPTTLRRSEDCFVDELFAGATQAGAPMIAANFPRAFCDPNREPWELDPAMFADDLPAWVNTTSARVGAGLGTLARVVASGEAIYRHKLPFEEAELRVHAYWQPYHDALQDLLESTRSRFGVCVLVDCHSMPAQGTTPRSEPLEFVLGDAHGTSCAPRVTRAAESALIEMGYRVRRNDPYAGGYVTRHYGRPRDHVHTLQVEIARSLYMDEARLHRADGFVTLQRRMTSFAASMARAATELAAIQEKVAVPKHRQV
ncbi:MAG: N-formylglutamate amidohydrolase [Pseudomonadota bacterium]|nr:N-formylglutamate amidohydrolase [Pseudomonadota bacterium]